MSKKCDGPVAGTLVDVMHPKTVDVQVVRREGEVSEVIEIRVRGPEKRNV
jgi:hypothetical protein